MHIVVRCQMMVSSTGKIGWTIECMGMKSALIRGGGPVYEPICVVIAATESSSGSGSMGQASAAGHASPPAHAS